MKKMFVTSTLALVTYFVLLSGAFVFATFYAKAPFLAFATQLTIGFVAYITKRYHDKKLNGGTHVQND